jgi:hypothetical protein
VRVNKPLRLLRLSLPVLLERNPRGKAVDRIVRPVSKRHDSVVLCLFSLSLSLSDRAVCLQEQFADGILEKAEPGPLRNAAQTLKMFIASVCSCCLMRLADCMMTNSSSPSHTADFAAQSRGAPLDKAQQSQTLDALRWELDASPSQQPPQEQLYPDCVELVPRALRPYRLRQRLTFVENG